MDVRWGKQLLCVEDDGVTCDLNAGDIARVNQVGEFNMEAAEEAFQRDLQHVEFRDLELNAIVGRGGELAN